MEKKSPDLVIVYDKYTESVANGISGKLAGTYTCLVQSNKAFESNKNSYSNNNRILFLTERFLIMQYLGMGDQTEYAIDAVSDVFEGGKCKVYTYLYSLGNWRAIEINIEKTAKTLSKKDIRNYYYYKYFGDFFWYYIYKKQRISKLFEGRMYEEAINFFFKKENIKLIIPD